VPSLAVGVLTVFTEPPTRLMQWMAENIGRQSWSSISIPGFTAYLLPIAYGAFLLGWRKRIRQP
jgi:hypothetical protein